MADLLLLEYARSIGVPCNGLQAGRRIGWTVDLAKAEDLRARGATVRPYLSRDPAYSGAEISFQPDAPVIAVTS